VFPGFYAVWPDKFQNKTNGITPRRWLNQANPALATVITRWLDTDEWLKNLGLLSGLRPIADHEQLQAEWIGVKQHCKERLAALVKKATGLVISTDALFDVQVKRFHEYKRQLLNALYCIHRYHWIRDMSAADKAHVVPRVIIFGGKAAPGYMMAKKIIKLINVLADKVRVWACHRPCHVSQTFSSVCPRSYHYWYSVLLCCISLLC
jgi:starch phosphorylase